MSHPFFWPQSEDHTVRLTFEQWKSLVNQYVVAKCGMDCDDIDDWNYTDAYRDGVSAKVAASRAIRNAMECCGL